MRAGSNVIETGHITHANAAIAFCRALNISARYGTGYLGDFDIEPEPFPMDVSAWFEAFLGGTWCTFDARFNTRRRGRILMARGRDAADGAVLTTFGPHRLVEWQVWTDAVRDVPDHVISEAGASQALYGRRWGSPAALRSLRSCRTVGQSREVAVRGQRPRCRVRRIGEGEIA
ncbi:MAG: transglutaminase family protein [Rhodospirillales bacterium]|nr:MAG: transglutaminase family protein [Rhodospirillales bacterium]